MDGIRSGNDQESCYEINYIKENALKLLLAGLGQKKWYGLFSGGGNEIQMEPTAVNHMLADMYQNGIIDWEGDGVAVRQPYSAMLSIMMEKKICITVQIPGAVSAIRCCYLSSEKVVITHKSQREKDTIGMAQISISNWFCLLIKECIRLEEGECGKLSCRHSENGNVYRNIWIQKKGLRALQMEWDNNENKRGSLICMQEEFVKNLRKMLLEDTGNDTD